MCKSEAGELQPQGMLGIGLDSLIALAAVPHPAWACRLHTLLTGQGRSPHSCQSYQLWVSKHRAADSVVISLWYGGGELQNRMIDNCILFGTPRTIGKQAYHLWSAHCERCSVLLILYPLLNFIPTVTFFKWLGCPYFPDEEEGSQGRLFAQDHRIIR